MEYLFIRVKVHRLYRKLILFKKNLNINNDY